MQFAYTAYLYSTLIHLAIVFFLNFMVEKKLNYLFFLLLASLWSGSFIAIKVVVNTFPPFLGAALRVAVALLFLFFFFYFSKRNTTIEFSFRWKIWLIGLFGIGFPFMFLFWGERSIQPGLAGILNGTAPIWAFIISALFLRQPMTTRKIFGLSLGIMGVIIIFWPLIDFDGVSMNLLGMLSVLLMAISYAIGATLNQRLLSGPIKIDFFANIYHQCCSSLLFLLVVSSMFESWPEMRSWLNLNVILASIYLGVFSTAIAWMIYYHLIRQWDAVRASAVMYIVPVMALVWDFLFFDNQPGVSEVVGIAAILTGVILIQFSNTKKL